jgi:hypothetical protein
VLVPLELYTAQHVMLGTVELGRRRLSDHLNDPTVDVVALTEAWIGELERPSTPPLRLAPANFHKRHLIFAVAMDRLDPPAGAYRPSYVRTSTVSIAASSGPYFVTGEVHLPSGVRFDINRLFGQGSRTFVPLTNAKLTFTPNPRIDSRHSVLLVRTDHIEFAGLVEGAPTSAPYLAAAMEDRMRTLIGGAGTGSRT